MLVFACCVGALMMGAVGMGGVVILPALLVAGIDVGPAIVSIYLAVMPASLMKLLVLGRTPGVIPWKAALSCGCTAAIGAAVGGVLVESAPRRALTFLVGAVAALAGVRDAREIVTRKLRQRRERVRAAETETEASPDAQGEGKLLRAETVTYRARQRRSTSRSSRRRRQRMRTKRQRDAVARFFVSPTLRGLFEDALLSPRGDARPARRAVGPTFQETAVLAAVGSLVGLASVLTGTGGPLILIPILLTERRGHEQEGDRRVLSR